MLYAEPALRLIAGGSIPPARIVAISGADKTVVVGGGNTSANIGVSYNGSRRAPGTGDDDGNAAVAGENIAVYGPGSVCQLESGGTVTRGDQITSDGANGRALTTTTTADRVVGIALDSATTNDLFDILVTVYTL